MNQWYTAKDHFALLPALMLALFGCAVLLFDFLASREQRHRKWLLVLTLAALVFTGASLFRQQTWLASQGAAELTAFQGSLVIDRLALFFNWIFLIAAAIVAVVSYRFLLTSGEPMGEYYGLLLFAQAGMFFLATGVDLIIVAVGLELMAVSFYILVGFSRGEKRSNEAAIKYLLLGAFSSGFLLYGFSLLYGLSGSTKFADIASAVTDRGVFDPIVFAALAASAVGMLFKISAVPFHMWAPDAYEGAPTPVTAYLSVASKAAAFALLIRLLLGPFGSARALWEPILIVAAVASLTLGNLAAISQSNVKRLLAYSSISHAGYMLLGLVAGNERGIQGIAVYVLVYTFMTLGAFLMVGAMERHGVAAEDIDDFAGLMHRHPGYALWMLVFLVSLAGIPPTAGFLGKYYIFLALIETGHYVLAVIATLYVAVALYYYFRIVRSMFLSDTAGGAPLLSGPGLRLAIGLSGVLTLVIGLYPEPFLQFVRFTGGGQ
ncbi:MAG TPA: NADH-quinone oxidoreductase subunit N [Bryobacteraceae bacterium]|nr:NADH-quinone oxidoreductase subunit N [Bryobacteraceae bacterium]